MMRWFRGWICLLFIAHAALAQKAPVSPDTLLLWISAGAADSQLEHVASNPFLDCRVTPQFAAVMRKAGAAPKLIQNLHSQNAPKTSCVASAGITKLSVLVHEKNYAAAEDQARALLQNDSDNSWLHFVLGSVLRDEDRIDDAFDEFTQSCKLTPGAPETHLQLAYLFYRQDDPENAIAEARTGLSMDPKSALGYRYLGLALYGDSQYDAALHAFEESLLRDPENADVYYDMGITLRDQ